MLGDDISTDAIYPGRFMAKVLPTETPKLAFADDAELNAKLNSGTLPRGSVIVAGRNFGCGSSREQAASCLRGHGITIVARAFAHISCERGAVRQEPRCVSVYLGSVRAGLIGRLPHPSVGVPER